MTGRNNLTSAVAGANDATGTANDGYFGGAACPQPAPPTAPISFSEPVTVGGRVTGPAGVLAALADSYQISCTSSGTNTTLESDGPTSYTLNPDADFANYESCTVTSTRSGSETRTDGGSDGGRRHLQLHGCRGHVSAGRPSLMRSRQRRAILFISTRT